MAEFPLEGDWQDFHWIGSGGISPGGTVAGFPLEGEWQDFP